MSRSRAFRLVALGAVMAAVAATCTIPSATAAGGVSLRGVVLDGEGKPVAGAEVRAWPWTQVEDAMDSPAVLREFSLPKEAASGVTDGQGRFRITPPAEGAYAVRVTKPGHALATRSGFVAVEGGGPSVEVRMGRSRLLEGRIVGAKGEPLSGLPVAAWRGVTDEAVVGRVFTKTDASGRFRIEGVASPEAEDGVARRYVLVRTPAGHLSKWTVPSEDERDLLLVVRTDCVVIGQVVAAEGGAAIPNALVRLLLLEGTDEKWDGATIEAQARTDEKGGCRIEGLPAGTLMFREAGRADVGFTQTTMDSGAGTRITAGAPSEFVDRVRRGTAVRGQVVDTRGRPVPAARVRIEPSNPWSESVLAGADGRFVALRSSPPVRGPFGAASDARAPGYVMTLESVMGTRDDPSDAVVVKLAKPARVTGVVRDETGRPVGGALVVVAEDERAWQYVPEATTGTDGSFVLPDLPPGSFYLDVTKADGSAPTCSPIEVPEGSQVVTSVRLGERRVRPDSEKTAVVAVIEGTSSTDALPFYMALAPSKITPRYESFHVTRISVKGAEAAAARKVLLADPELAPFVVGTSQGPTPVAPRPKTGEPSAPPEVDRGDAASRFLSGWAEPEGKDLDPATRFPTRIRRIRDEMVMVLVPGGTFQMGAAPTDPHAGGKDERRHSVTLTKAYYMDEHEVTNRQFSRYVDATGTDVEYGDMVFMTDDTGDFGGWKRAEMGNPTWRLPLPHRRRPADWASHPVVLVGWGDAEAYCAWVGPRRPGGSWNGEGVTLPTEAQFERALRGGLEDKIYPWGDSLPPPRGAGNLPDDAMVEHFGFAKLWESKGPIAGYRDDFLRSAPVKSFEANAYGLHDLCGNVWEFCYDQENGPKRSATGATHDPVPRSGLDECVVRGNGWGPGWGVDGGAPRASNRAVVALVFGSDCIGFRCVRSLP